MVSIQKNWVEREKRTNFNLASTWGFQTRAGGGGRLPGESVSKDREKSYFLFN